MLKEFRLKMLHEAKTNCSMKKLRGELFKILSKKENIFWDDGLSTHENFNLLIGMFAPGLKLLIKRYQEVIDFLLFQSNFMRTLVDYFSEVS